MPTTITNQANLSYRYDDTTLNTTSNTVSTIVNDIYTLAATKRSTRAVYRPGDYVFYIGEIESLGTGNIYDLTITDDLGLQREDYIPNSLSVYLNGDRVSVTPTAITPSLIFILPFVLNQNDKVTYMYQTRVKSTVNDAVIINTVEIVGKEGSATGPEVRVTPHPTALLTLENYADVSIFKEVDKTTINTGESLEYTFTLLNTGNTTATNNVITDTLPTGFIIQSIEVITNGVTTTYDSTMYDLTSNVLTLPNATATPITVPAATSSMPGETKVIIRGIVNM